MKKRDLLCSSFPARSFLSRRGRFRFAVAAIGLLALGGCSGGGPDTLMSLFSKDTEKWRAEGAVDEQNPPSDAAAVDGQVASVGAGGDVQNEPVVGGQPLSLMSEKERQEAESELRRLAERSEQQTRSAPAKSETSWLKKLRNHADDALRKIAVD
jgi:hypothetical protein